jgi:hypothetical protein
MSMPIAEGRHQESAFKIDQRGTIAKAASIVADSAHSTITDEYGIGVASTCPDRSVG